MSVAFVAAMAGVGCPRRGPTRHARGARSRRCQDVTPLTSLRNCFHDASADCFFCSTRSIARLEAVWMSPWFGPVICGFSFFAEVVKICPTGALLKKGFLNVETALLEYSAGWLGRLP